MTRIRRGAWTLVLAALGTDLSFAQRLDLHWGLENTYAYYEVPNGRAEDEDLATKRPASKPRHYRAFAFADGSSEVRDPWLACIERVMTLWPTHASSGAAAPPGSSADAQREAFRVFLAKADPVCMGRFNKTAPRLYFDFTSDAAQEVVLERLEVTTLAFSEYRGGGFAEKEQGYDILLSHAKGTKLHYPEPRLVFKDHGRVTLRLWSDNFYPKQGWIAPMGEYTLDIRFVFSSAGKTLSVSTGPFKIDV